MTEDKAKQILSDHQLDGISNPSNNKAWSQRAKDNSYQPDKAQSRHDLGGEGAAKDAKGDWSDKWQVPQKKTEGRCYADVNPAPKPNTYTGPGGSKRD